MSTLSAFFRHVMGYRRSQSLGAELFQPGPDDVYLASYPRSGNTWLRAVIAEIMFGDSGANIKDLDCYVPDIYVPQPKASVVPSKFHVIKTHEAYHHEQRQRLKRVIYVVRDPRDVAVSYYRYSHRLGKYDGSFDAFLVDWLGGRVWPCSWREHVTSWAGASREISREGLLILRYEDLLSDPEHHVQAIAEYLGYSLGQARLNEVIQRTTSEQMREKERAGMRSTERAQGFQFIGSAKAGGWRESLSQQQEALISELLGPLISHFEYRPACSEAKCGGSVSKAA
jgi:hypothetical protein